VAVVAVTPVHPFGDDVTLTTLILALFDLGGALTTPTGCVVLLLDPLLVGYMPIMTE
jgi:hypothetical protein